MRVPGLFYTNFYKRSGAMPYKPKRGCQYPGCIQFTNKEYCLDHQKMMTKAYNQYTRSPDHNRKYGYQWKRVRARYAKEHPLCEMCFKEGRYTRLDEVHHIIPVSRGGTNDTTNLMSLCRSYHNKIHIELGDRN